MQTWMRLPTSVIGGKADMARGLSVRPLMTLADIVEFTASTLPHLKFLPRRSEIAKLIQVIAQK